MVALDELQRRYLAAQLQGDRKEAIRLIMEEGLGGGASVRELQLCVVQQAQREIGRLWEENAISVADEHMASAISNVVLSHLYCEAPVKAKNGRSLLVACVEGEQHDLPARLLSDTLELEGYDVFYLGADVPLEDLLRAIADRAPQMLCLSVTMSFNLPSLETTIARVRERFSALPIAVGGYALADGVARTADIFADDANLFLTALERHF